MAWYRVVLQVRTDLIPEDWDFNGLLVTDPQSEKVVVESIKEIEFAND